MSTTPIPLTFSVVNGSSKIDTYVNIVESKLFYDASGIEFAEKCSDSETQSNDTLLDCFVLKAGGKQDVSISYDPSLIYYVIASSIEDETSKSTATKTTPQTIIVFEGDSSGDISFPYVWSGPNSVTIDPSGKSVTINPSSLGLNTMFYVVIAMTLAILFAIWEDSHDVMITLIIGGILVSLLFVYAQSAGYIS